MKTVISILVVTLSLLSCSKKESNPVENGDSSFYEESVVFGQLIADTLATHFQAFTTQDTVDFGTFRSDTNIAIRVTEVGIPYSDTLFNIAKRTVVHVQTLNDQEMFQVDKNSMLMGCGWSTPGNRYFREVIMPIRFSTSPVPSDNILELSDVNDVVQILIHSEFSDKTITAMVFLKKGQ